MFEEHNKFDYLEFHLSQVIATDGSKLKKAQVGKQVYIPTSLQTEMNKRGHTVPNSALHEIYFQRPTNIESESEQEEDKPKFYKVIKAYHDDVIKQGRGQ